MGKHVAKKTPEQLKKEQRSRLIAIAAAVLAVVLLVLVIVLLPKKKPAEPVMQANTPPTIDPAKAEEVFPTKIYDSVETFVISCIGDNTLWSSVQFEQSNSGLPLTVGEDYAYPFSATAQYFKEDEYTLSNIECTFSDTKLKSAEQFYFCAPNAYANILVEGGVDFVTTANNHMMDFGDNGADSTYAALEAAGIPYGKELEAQIVETPNGLKLGIITAGIKSKPYDSESRITADIASLKEDGAQYVICMFHWGKELYYTPNEDQVKLAHACIDAGADLVYGSHPHCLQPVEQYKEGLILYSVGNWCFGGNTAPSDPDTAIIQVTLERDEYGNVRTKTFSAIPCCVSGKIDEAMGHLKNSNQYGYYNDYCPTPYEKDSDAYDRVISKLSGTFEAKSQGADYSNFYASWG